MNFSDLINRGKAVVTGGETAPAKPKLPPAIANRSREELQVTVVDLIKKLKDKDKQLESLKAASKVAGGNGPSAQELQEHLQEAQQQLFTYSTKIEELQSEKETWAAADKKLQEAAEKESMFQQQLTSLKEALRDMAEERETAFTRLGEEREKVGELQDALSEKEQLVEKHAARISQLEADLETSNESAAAAHQKLTDAEEKLSSALADNEKLNTELESAKHDADAAKAMVLELKNGNETSGPADDSSRRVAELEAQLASSTAQYEEVKSKLDDVCKQLTETQERLTVAESTTSSRPNADGADCADTSSPSVAVVRPEVVEQLESKVAALEAELARSREEAASAQPEAAARVKALEEQLHAHTTHSTQAEPSQESMTSVLDSDSHDAQDVLSPVSARRIAHEENGTVGGNETSAADESSKSEAEWSQLRSAKERIKALETQLSTQVASNQELEKARVRIAALESDLAVEKSGTQKLDQLAKQMNQMASALQLGSVPGAGLTRPRLVRGNSVRMRVEKLEQQFEIVKEGFQKRARDKPAIPAASTSSSDRRIPSTRSPAPTTKTAPRSASTTPRLDPPQISESPRTDAPSTPKPQGERTHGNETSSFTSASHQESASDHLQTTAGDGDADQSKSAYRVLFHGEDSDDLANGQDGRDTDDAQPLRHSLDESAFRRASLDATTFVRSSLDETSFRNPCTEDDGHDGDEMSEEGGLEFSRSGRISISDMSPADLEEELNRLSQRVMDLENANEALVMLCDQSSSELQVKLQLLSAKDGRIHELEAAITGLRLQLAGAERVQLGVIHSSHSDEVECLALPYPPPGTIHTSAQGGDLAPITRLDSRESSSDGSRPVVPTIPTRTLSQTSDFNTPRGPSLTPHHCSPSPGRRAPDTPTAERLSRLTSQLEAAVCERDSLQVQLAELSAESERQAKLLETAERECHLAVATLQGQMEELNRHWEATQEEKSQLQAYLEQQQADRTKLSEELQAISNTKSQLEAELAETAGKSLKLQEDVSNAESAKVQLQEEVAELHASKAKAEEDLGTLRAENEDLKERVSKLNESVDQLEQALAEERKQMSQLQSESSHRQEAAEKLQNELQVQSQLVSTAQAEASEHKENVEKLKEELGRLQSEHSATQDELRQLRDQHAIKVEEHAGSLEKHRELEQLLETATAGSRALQEQLEAERGLAVQLDAVLQEKAQLEAALRDTGGMTEQQQQLLHDANQKLQTALIELDSERRKLAQSAEELKEAAGKNTQLQEELKEAAGKNTRLQEELTQAAAALAEANSRVDAEVTSKQAVQDQLKAMTVRLTEHEREQSGWSEQVSKLEKDLASTVGVRDSLQSRVAELNERVIELEKGEADWSERVAALNEQVNLLRKDNEALQQEVQSATETGSSQSERVQRLLLQLKSVEAEREESVRSLGQQLEEEKKSHVEALATQTTQLQAEKDALAERIIELQGLSSQTAQLQEEKDALAERIIELQGLSSQIAQLQEEKDALTKRILQLEGLTAEVAQLQEEKDGLAKKIIELQGLTAKADQVQALDGLLEERTAQVDGLTAEVSKLQADKQALQERLEALEQVATEAEQLKSDHAKLTQQLVDAGSTRDELRKQLESITEDKVKAAEHAAQLEADLTSERTAVAALEAAKVAAEASANDKQQQLEEVDEKLRETEQKLSDVEARLQQQLSSAAEGAESQSAADDRVRALEQETAALRQEISENKRKFVQVAKKKQGEYTAKISKLEHEIAQLQPQVQEVVQLREQLERLSLELAESSAKSLADIDEKSAQVSGLLAAISQKEFQCNSLSGKLETEAARAASLSSQLQELQQALVREEDKARQKDLECESLKMELKKSEDAVQAATRELAGIDRGAGVKVEQLSSKMEALQQELDTAKQEASSAKEELAAKETDRQKALRALDGVKKRLDKAVREKTAAEEKMAELRTKNEEAQASCLEATQQLQVANRDRTKLEMEMKEYRSRAQMLLKVKERELQSIKQGPEPGESSNPDLEEAHARIIDLQGQLESTSSTLESLRQHHAEELFELQCKSAAETARLTESLEFTEASLQQLKTECEELRLKNETLEARLQRQGHASHNALLASSMQAAEESKRELQAARLTITTLQQQLDDQEVNFASYRSTTDSMMEAKDGEVLLLLRKNALLQEELSSVKRNGAQTGGQEATTSGHPPVSAQTSVSERPPLSPLRNTSSVFHSPAPGLSPLAGSIPPSPLRDSQAVEVGMKDKRRTSASELLDGIINASNPPPATTHVILDEDGGGLSDGSPTRLSVSDEKAFMTLAARQAERDDALAVIMARNKELEGEVADLLKEVQLREEMEAALKEEIREWERSEKRQDTSTKPIDMEYLKNTVVKLLETGQAEPLLPVLATLLSLSPSEVERCKEAVSKQAMDGSSAQGSIAGSAVEQSSSIVSSLSDWTTWALGGGTAATTPTVRRT